MIQTLRIATRKSPLALWQAEFVKTELLKHYPDLDISLVPMSTQGDKILDVPLAKIGGKGLFIKELEVQMQAGNADLAVHSMKDLPAELPPGFVIATVLPRHNPTDAFVSNRYKSFDQLPQEATIGTSSLRRRAQLHAARGDLIIDDLRGNIHTRLQKLDDGLYDAIILATSGLERMNLHDRIRHTLDTHLCLPAVTQGALAIEICADNEPLAQLLSVLNDDDTQARTTAERAFNRVLEGGCQVPIGSYAELQKNQLWLRGLVASLDGTTIIQGEITGTTEQANELGETLAQQLLAQGAGDILRQVYKQSETGTLPL